MLRSCCTMYREQIHLCCMLVRYSTSWADRGRLNSCLLELHVVPRSPQKLRLSSLRAGILVQPRPYRG